MRLGHVVLFSEGAYIVNAVWALFKGEPGQDHMHPLSLCPPTLCVRVLVIFHVHGTCMASYIYVDSTTSEPLETLQPSRFRPPVITTSDLTLYTCVLGNL